MLLEKNNIIIKKLFLATIVLIGVLLLLNFSFNSANIIMILDSAGVHVSTGFAYALTTISGVYGVQQFIIGALGVTVPIWAAAAVATAGAVGI